MGPNNIASIGYSLQALAFAGLFVLILARRGTTPYSRYFGAAAGVTLLAGGVLVSQSLQLIPLGSIVVAIEWARSVAWIVLLLAVLRSIDKDRQAEIIGRRYGIPLIASAFVLLLTYSNTRLETVAVSLLVCGGVLMGLVLIALVEQVYRNLPPDSSSVLKYVCIALLVMAGYDIVMFVRWITEGGLEAAPWAARGFVNALVAVPLAWSALGSESDSMVDGRRRAVLYTATPTLVGGGIALWLLSDLFVANYGKTWSDVATIVIVSGAVLFSGVLLASASMRARVRVSLTKVFFRYKYDYRKEWLRFIATLSESGLENVPATAVRAVGQIVNSPGGIVWVVDEYGDKYVPIGSWRCDIPQVPPIGKESNLVQFLIDRQWVIDLEEKQRYPARYGGLELEPFFQGSNDWWLIVPLFLGKRLFGLVCLRRPRIIRSLNFEDHDLLRTVGRHVGTHINQAESDKRLAESSQFGTYNRLTAFLMHDLNNLIAQQSLVVTNAERFRENPEFVDDAIGTIANSVSRMKRLMKQLTSGFKTPAQVRSDLRDALAEATDRCRALRPQPELLSPDTPVYVLADPERLTNVFEHLIRNAQDATPDHGEIQLALHVSGEWACVSISDTGQGMSAEFIRERLFRPFDSTKGSQSMGIGAYQARDYVRMLGGQLEVTSEVGVGTEFSIRLPVL